MAKRLSTNMLNSIEIEYMTSHLTIEELEDKYGVELPTSKTHNWRKAPEYTPTDLSSQDIATSYDINLDKSAVITTPISMSLATDIANVVSTVDIDTDLEKVKELKATLLTKVENKINALDEYADTKEIKDLVSILDTLEKSYDKTKDEDKQPSAIFNLNIKMASLISKYEQDC